jgi:hypothetical protein
MLSSKPTKDTAPNDLRLTLSFLIKPQVPQISHKPLPSLSLRFAVPHVLVQASLYFVSIVVKSMWHGILHPPPQTLNDVRMRSGYRILEVPLMDNNTMRKGE